MTADTSDTDWVRRQLIEEVQLTVRRFAEPRPFGSTVALEEFAEVELVQPWVTIGLETDTLPVDVVASGVWNEVEVLLRFWGPQVWRGRVIYAAEILPGR